MLTAKTKTGEPITLGGDHQKEELLELRRLEQFYCPICGEPVVLKLGDQRIFHFAHQNKHCCSECHEGETIYHMKGKLQLFQWIKSQGIPCVLEYYDKDLKQRPDVMFTYNGHRYALEFQCSMISEELFIKRTTYYLQNGYSPLWIVSLPNIKKKKKNQLSLTNFAYLFLQLTSNYIYQIPVYCPETKVFHLLQSLKPYSIKNTFTQQVQFPLNTIKIENLLSPKQSRSQVSMTGWVNELEQYNRNWALRSDTIRNPFLCELYRHNLNLFLLPPELGLPVPHSFFIQTPPVIWQSYLFLDFIKNKEPGALISIKEIYGHVFKRINRKEILLRNLPQIPDVNPMKPVMEYIQLLCRLNLITQKGDASFVIINKIVVPKTNREREEVKQLFLLKNNWLL
ncbi:competence protein CoiA [Neobacillus sp. LXY-1]|uniref:competence protein CoiA n=1 Tax=Neobacillus sp. LXY-1 TaxID=3379133 RepID=UPI003EE18AD6